MGQRYCRLVYTTEIEKVGVKGEMESGTKALWSMAGRGFTSGGHTLFSSFRLC